MKTPILLALLLLAPATLLAQDEAKPAKPAARRRSPR